MYKKKCLLNLILFSDEILAEQGLQAVWTRNFRQILHGPGQSFRSTHFGSWQCKSYAEVYSFFSMIARIIVKTEVTFLLLRLFFFQI